MCSASSDDAQRAADLAVHLRVRVAIDADAIRRAVVRAQEAVADVHARLRQQLAAMDRAVDADQHGELDRAGRVEPAIAVVIELRSRLEIARWRRASARAPASALELSESVAQLGGGAQRRDRRTARGAGVTWRAVQSQCVDRSVRLGPPSVDLSSSALRASRDPLGASSASRMSSGSAPCSGRRHGRRGRRTGVPSVRSASARSATIASSPLLYASAWPGITM